MPLPEGITQLDVLTALSDLDADISHDYGPPTRYQLVHGDRVYPPKAAIGLAARRVAGRYVSSREFSGGEGPGAANSRLRSLGFTVERLRASSVRGRATRGVVSGGSGAPVRTTCQACVAGFGVVQRPIGDRGEAIGTCANCHSHACGYHGHRDANVPEFICVECDPSLLVASAAMLVRRGGGQPSPGLDAAARTYHRYPTEGSWVVASVEEWAGRRATYSFAQAQGFITRGSDRTATAESPQLAAAQALIAASMGLASHLDIPSSRMASSMRALFGLG